jgi:hypothetical protein
VGRSSVGQSSCPVRIALVNPDHADPAKDRTGPDLSFKSRIAVRSGSSATSTKYGTRRSKLNEGADVLNSVIRSVSQQHGLSFTDVRDRFAGHGVCSTNPWINGPSVSASVGRYHPNQTGYRDGYLEALDTTTTGSSAAA